MPFLDFPGEALYPVDDVTRPVIPVRFVNPSTGTAVNETDLLDTGADTSLVTLDVLRILGFDLDALSTRMTVGTAGEVKSYEADVVMQLCGTSFAAKVVCPDIEGLRYNLLGREPLFRHVHFAFEEYEDPRRNRILWKLP